MSTAATKNRGRADFAFTYKGTKWKWVDPVWQPNNTSANEVSTLSPEPLTTYGKVRGAVNRYGSDASRRGKTEAEGSLTVRQVLREVGCPASKIPLATAIIAAESGGNAAAVNINTDQFKSKDVGLAQINLHYHPEYTEAQMKEPRANLRAMRKISKNFTDFSPWATYISGAYTSHLNGADIKITNAADSTGPGQPDSVIEDVVDAATDTASQVADVAGAGANILKSLLDPSTYFRLGKGLLGAVILLLGIWALFELYLKSSGSSSPKPIISTPGPL